MLVDSHCHIHEADYKLDREEAYQRAVEAGVSKMIVVGTDEESSQRAIEFAATHEHAWASVGLHPHEAKKGAEALKLLEHLAGQPRVVAVGEIGLDFHYNNSPKEDQIKMLRGQIEIALDHDLPVIFHVRDAYDDFWPVFDEFKHKHIKGVVHSFTDSEAHLQNAIKRNLYVGVNGISTFTKSDAQKAMFGNIPMQNLLVETDAPFLTPVPKRGTINEPAYVKFVADYLAELRGVSPRKLIDETTHNADNLFFN